MKNNIQSRFKMTVLAMLMSFIVVLLLVIATADNSYAESRVKYLDASGTEQTQDGCISVSSVPDSPYPTLGGSDGKEKWYVLDSNVTYSNYRLTILGKVNLILKDGMTLNTFHGIRMAANRPEGARLTVYAQSTEESSMGVLEANASGEDSCAGIGGNNAEAGGSVIINGGKITARGGKYGAGIGGGEDRSGDSVTINNGIVTATGGEYGAGIGGGEGGSGGNININGGNVTANGGYRAAGIGGGQKWRGGGSGGNITISKATVTATAGKDGAGIGGGQDGEGGNITINSGEITAMGGDDGRGAGIGGGVDAHAGTITINSGTIKAYGGKAKYDTYGEDGGGAGIGAGYDNDDGSNKKTAGGHVIINGGTITAVGGYLEYSNGGARNPGAGIGSGAGGYGLRIEIHGGKIDGSSPTRYGASIGGGDEGSGGHISIDNKKGDPTITAETLRGSKKDYDSSYCIGNGYDYSGEQATVDFDYPNGKIWIQVDILVGNYFYEKFLDKGQRGEHIKYGNGHYRRIKIMPCDHAGSKITKTAEGHKIECRYCSAHDEDVESHEYKEGEWDHNNNQHWKVCTVCGYETPLEAHDMTQGICQCGYSDSIQISDSALILNEGEEKNGVSITVDSGITDDQISWTSSDDTVATVAKVDGKNGREVKIKALKEGKATITVQVAETNLKENCKVTVEHTHNLREVGVTKQPTCTENGSIKYYWCDVDEYGCEKTFYGEDGTGEFSLEHISTYDLFPPATGHQGEWELVKEPTQREPGELKRKCELCPVEQTVTTTKASPAALAEMLSRADEAQKGIVASKDGSDVDPAGKWAPAAAFDVLKAAVKKAKGVKDNLDATQKQLCDAAEELKAAVQAFQDEIKIGTKGKGDDPAPVPTPQPDPSQKDRKDQKGKDGTAFGPGAAIEAAEAGLASLTKETDPAGTKFAPLMLKSTKQTKKSIKITWKKVKGATKYIIYANKRGKGMKLKKLATAGASGKSYNAKKAAGKKLKKGKYYKFMVIAVDKNNNVVTSSKTIHVATAGSKKAANYKAVVVKAKVSKAGKKLKKYKKINAIAVKVKKTVQLKAKATKAKKTKVKKLFGIRYESSNTSVVSVTKKGKVKGLKKGTAKVYCFADNGVCKTIKVKVK